MILEDQLSCLAELGLPMAPGRTVAELLHSFPRESYESEAFTLLLNMLGNEVEAEPWGRRFCDRVWNFDTECVYGSGDYVDIAQQLCRIAGQPDVLSEVRDHIDLDAGEGWIEYSVGERRCRWEITVNDDWADFEVVAHLMAELETTDRRFYAMDNGQAMVLMFLTDAAAHGLNELATKDLVAPAW